MSFNRKNWSALSSLAQQWSAEDEEEQERERRRRHRQLSSSSEVKVETPSAVQNATSRAPNRFRSPTEAKPSKLVTSKLENERKQVDILNKQEDRRVRKRVEMFNNVKQDKKETLDARKLKKEAVEEKVKSPSEPPQEQKDPIVEKCEVLVQQKDPAKEKHQKLDQEKKETAVEKRENLDQEVKDPNTDKDQVFIEEQKSMNTHESQRLSAVQNEVATQQPQRTSWERKSISRLEVKIQPRARNISFHEVPRSAATPASVPQATERSIPKTEGEAVSCPSHQDGSEAPLLISHPVITYSSSFKRTTPRTISFRVVSKKDKEEDTLSRSTSMRLPVNAAKLEERREKYASAVQRAGSIKLPPSARRNFQLASEGVASKRSIFETNIRAEPTTTLIRKESLKIPGGVTSRINLWISRTQESSKDEGVKDIRRIENTQQSQWGKRSNDS
ncbi:ladinin-1 [Elgaria multicarinata webbii]|uniref:ladinin-1 n=1 Tax=Elgaria multicarinata webbii TaxID=159646 RepID=UPI002FCD52B7